MKFVDIELDGAVFRAQLLDQRSPNATTAMWDALPFEGLAVHGQWSGAIFRMLEHAPFALEHPDPPAGFQHPGLVVLEPGSKEIAICYGQGRLVSPTRQLEPVPLAEIGGDLSTLAELGLSLQFDGAKQISFRKSTDQSSTLAGSAQLTGPRVEVRLGESTAVARLLDDRSPALASEFGQLLPLTGRASNTYSGGPLIRFWNDAGGSEGVTPIETQVSEAGQTVLYPGYLYYLPSHPVRGIRIPLDATAMSGASNSPSPRLIPIAKFDSDWSGLREQARRILVDGAMAMSFRLLD